MSLLLKNLRLPGTSDTTNILIENGIIQKIGSDIQAKDAATEKDLQGAWASVGWMDSEVNTADPGFEHREDLQSTAEAAAFGGFTAVGCLPNTQPVIQSKSEIAYLKNNTSHLLVDFHPIGALSHDCKGKEITEMIEMHHAGAIAFSDGIHSVQNSGLMLRALQYVKTFDGLVINRPMDAAIDGGGQMHEGYVSTTLGIKGSPSLAEELMIQRDLYLTAYAESRLLIAGVSTARGVELIRKAKSEGLQVHAAVAALNLLFDESALSTFNSNLKVIPPLRAKSDMEALWAGLADGTIDMIIANHQPLEDERKKLEFAYADFGAIGLETTFAALHTKLQNRLSAEKLIDILANGARRCFGLVQPEIAEGKTANLTLVDPEKEWTYERRAIRSKSSNSPFIDARFRGKVVGVVNGEYSLFLD